MNWDDVKIGDVLIRTSETVKVECGVIFKDAGIILLRALNNSLMHFTLTNTGPLPLKSWKKKSKKIKLGYFWFAGVNQISELVIGPSITESVIGNYTRYGKCSSFKTIEIEESDV